MREPVEHAVHHAGFRTRIEVMRHFDIFGDDDAEPLIGANALREFLLMVDPVEERLVSRTGRMKPLERGRRNCPEHKAPQGPKELEPVTGKGE